MAGPLPPPSRCPPSRGTRPARPPAARTAPRPFLPGSRRAAAGRGPGLSRAAGRGAFTRRARQAGPPGSCRCATSRTPGPSCLPALLLDGTDGDLLAGAADSQAHHQHWRSSVNAPGHPSAGFAALQVAPRRDPPHRDFPQRNHPDRAPVSEACLRPATAPGRLRLPGLRRGPGSPRTPAASSPSTARETVPASLFRGAGDPGRPRRRAARPCGWCPGSGSTRAPRPPDTASGTIGSGHLGSARVAGHRDPRRRRVNASPGPRSAPAPTPAARACQPITPPPAAAVLRPLALLRPAGLAGYGALVRPGPRTVMATLSDGTAERITPVTVGGRGYVRWPCRPAPR